MLVKAFIVLIMLLILFSLGSGLFYLLRDGSDKRRIVKALSWRIGLSLALFILLLLAFALGIITPHGIGR